MPKTEELYCALATLAPTTLAEGWDNVGWLVDAGAEETSAVLVTLDITPEVVAEAKAKGCGLVVSHHPVIFSPLKRLAPQDVAVRLVQNGISAICMHTNLDACPGGVNDTLAALLGMKNATPFAEGCGRVGEIAPTTVPALAQACGTLLGASVKYSDAGRPVTRLAVISGAGGSMFAEAAAQGADCLVTGEASHHHALDAKALGLSIIAAGHYETEWPVVAVLAEYLRGQFPGLRVECSEANKSPFVYL